MAAEALANPNSSVPMKFSDSIDAAVAAKNGFAILHLSDGRQVTAKETAIATLPAHPSDAEILKIATHVLPAEKPIATATATPQPDQTIEGNCGTSSLDIFDTSVSRAEEEPTAVHANYPFSYVLLAGVELYNVNRVVEKLEFRYRVHGPTEFDPDTVESILNNIDGSNLLDGILGQATSEGQITDYYDWDPTPYANFQQTGFDGVAELPGTYQASTIYGYATFDDGTQCVSAGPEDTVMLPSTTKTQQYYPD